MSQYKYRVGDYGNNDYYARGKKRDAFLLVILQADCFENAQIYHSSGLEDSNGLKLGSLDLLPPIGNIFDEV